MVEIILNKIKQKSFFNHQPFCSFLCLIEKYQRFFNFCIVGVIGTVIDIGLLYCLVEYFYFPVLFATTISFCVAVINNYFLNKYFTFKSIEKNSLKQFIKYFSVSLIGLGINNTSMYFLINYLLCWYIYSKMMTTLVVLFWNFLANKYWTFKTKENTGL